MADKAEINITATQNGTPVQFFWNGNYVDELCTPTTDDLPQDALGEAVCEAVQTLWKSGYDPTTIELHVQFR